MNALARPDRIAPLIGKLGSPHDGEVLTAARAIGRELAKAGLGFNDLAARLTAAPGARGPAPAPRPQTPAAMVEWLSRRRYALTEKEAEFVANLARHAWREEAMPITARQLAWLEGIFARVRAGEAGA